MSRVNEPGVWGNGAYRGERFLRGTWVRGMYAGARVADGLPVLLARCPFWINFASLGLGYEIPGIVPTFGVHKLDGFVPNAFMPSPTVLVEVMPRGELLDTHRGHGTAEDCVRLGCSLMRCVVPACEAGVWVAGLRPESVFVDGVPGTLAFTGAAPRTAVAVGCGPLYATVPAFAMEEYDGEDLNQTPAQAAYAVALTLWVTMQAVHPFGELTTSAQRSPRGDCDPWLGPPELGRILQPMLAYKVGDRPSPQWMQAELEDLAQRWGIEPTPFPPTWPSPPHAVGPYR